MLNGNNKYDFSKKLNEILSHANKEEREEIFRFLNADFEEDYINVN